MSLGRLIFDTIYATKTLRDNKKNDRWNLLVAFAHCMSLKLNGMYTFCEVNTKSCKVVVLHGTGT